jgi:hypothetical protein
MAQDKEEKEDKKEIKSKRRSTIWLKVSTVVWLAVCARGANAQADDGLEGRFRQGAAQTAASSPLLA